MFNHKYSDNSRLKHAICLILAGVILFSIIAPSFAEAKSFERSYCSHHLRPKDKLMERAPLFEKTQLLKKVSSLTGQQWKGPFDFQNVLKEQHQSTHNAMKRLFELLRRTFISVRALDWGYPTFGIMLEAVYQTPLNLLAQRWLQNKGITKAVPYAVPVTVAGIAAAGIFYLCGMTTPAMLAWSISSAYVFGFAHKKITLREHLILFGVGLALAGSFAAPVLFAPDGSLLLHIGEGFVPNIALHSLYNGILAPLLKLPLASFMHPAVAKEMMRGRQRIDQLIAPSKDEEGVLIQQYREQILEKNFVYFLRLRQRGKEHLLKQKRQMELGLENYYLEDYEDFMDAKRQFKSWFADPEDPYLDYIETSELIFFDALVGSGHLMDYAPRPDLIFADVVGQTNDEVTIRLRINEIVAGRLNENSKNLSFSIRNIDPDFPVPFNFRQVVEAGAGVKAIDLHLEELERTEGGKRFLQRLVKTHSKLNRSQLENRLKSISKKANQQAIVYWDIIRNRLVARGLISKGQKIKIEFEKGRIFAVQVPTPIHSTEFQDKDGIPFQEGDLIKLTDMAAYTLLKDIVYEILRYFKIFFKVSKKYGDPNYAELWTKSIFERSLPNNFPENFIFEDFSKKVMQGPIRQLLELVLIWQSIVSEQLASSIDWVKLSDTIRDIQEYAHVAQPKNIESGGESQTWNFQKLKNHLLKIFAGGQVEKRQSLWMILWERPGYSGKKRDEKTKTLNEKFGEGNWKTVWRFADSFVEFDFILQYYEEAYETYFAAHPDVLKWLVHYARDVYDTSPTNVLSGLDYNIQEGAATHLQDIAIRRVVHRQYGGFKGTELLQIRGSKKPGGFLNPGRISFHKPEWIVTPGLKGWWEPGSIEDFYQSNKITIVKREALTRYLFSEADLANESLMGCKLSKTKMKLILAAMTYPIESVQNQVIQGPLTVEDGRSELFNAAKMLAHSPLWDSHVPAGKIRARLLRLYSRWPAGPKNQWVDFMRDRIGEGLWDLIQKKRSEGKSISVSFHIGKEAQAKEWWKDRSSLYPDPNTEEPHVSKRKADIKFYWKEDPDGNLYITVTDIWGKDNFTRIRDILSNAGPTFGEVVDHGYDFEKSLRDAFERAIQDNNLSKEVAVIAPTSFLQSDAQAFVSFRNMQIILKKHACDSVRQYVHGRIDRELERIYDLETEKVHEFIRSLLHSNVLPFPIGLEINKERIASNAEKNKVLPIFKKILIPLIDWDLEKTLDVADHVYQRRQNSTPLSSEEFLKKRKWVAAYTRLFSKHPKGDGLFVILTSILRENGFSVGKQFSDIFNAEEIQSELNSYQSTNIVSDAEQQDAFRLKILVYPDGKGGVKRIPAVDILYGDLTGITAKVMNDLGFKKLIFIGSAGYNVQETHSYFDIKDTLRPGDILVPTTVQDQRGQIIHGLSNHGLEEVLGVLNDGDVSYQIVHMEKNNESIDESHAIDPKNSIRIATVHHGHVPSLSIESESYMKKLWDSGINTVEVEGAHILKNFKGKLTLLFYLSDFIGTTSENFSEASKNIHDIKRICSSVFVSLISSIVQSEVPSAPLSRKTNKFLPFNSIADPWIKKFLKEGSRAYYHYTTKLAPAWEEFLFRFLPLSLSHTTLSSLSTLSPMGLGMIFCISIGLFAFSHIIVRWFVRAHDRGWSKGYLPWNYATKNDLPHLLQVLIPSTFFTVVYLISLQFMPFSSSILSHLFSYIIVVFVHGAYNTAILKNWIPEWMKLGLFDKQEESLDDEIEAVVKQNLSRISFVSYLIQKLSSTDSKLKQTPVHLIDLQASVFNIGEEGFDLTPEAQAWGEGLGASLKMQPSNEGKPAPMAGIIIRSNQKEKIIQILKAKWGIDDEFKLLVANTPDEAIKQAQQNNAKIVSLFTERPQEWGVEFIKWIVTLGTGNELRVRGEELKMLKRALQRGLGAENNHLSIESNELIIPKEILGLDQTEIDYRKNLHFDFSA